MKKFKQKRESRSNRTYTQRSYLTLSLTLGNLCMITLCVLTTLISFYYLLTLHMYETILISELKTNQIRSQTIAQLKQFDLTLTNNDIWSSSMTLSDLVSDPDRYQLEHYESRSNVDVITEDAYELGMRLN